MAMHEDAHLQKLRSYIIQGRPHKKDELEHSMIDYWLIRSTLVMINGISMNGKKIIIPFLLQKQILQQLPSNQGSIEKMRL